MKPVRHVAIVGAGLAGLACAAAAASAGVRVDVFERAGAPADPPAHVDVVPNLLRDLATLGMAEACVRQGFVHQGVRVVDAGSGTRFDLLAPRLAGGHLPSSLGMRHGALLRLLAETAHDRGARLHWGATVASVDAAHATVELAEGAECHADLVLLAGGSRCALRRGLLLGAELPAASQDGWYALLPRPADLDRSCWLLAPGGRKAHLVPVALDRAGVAVLRPAAALNALPPQASRAASLRALLREFPAPLAVVAEYLHDADAVAIRPLHSGLLPRPWHRGALLAVGEGAHALPPHFGQAAAQSVEDAVVLGELLAAQHPRDELLQRFDARRFPRARQVHAIAAQAARWDLAPNPATDLQRLAAALQRVVEQAA